MKIKFFTVVAFMLFAVAQIEASPGYAYSPQRPTAQVQVPSPEVVLREAMTNLLKFMRQKDRSDPEAVAAYIETKIAPYFDFAYMAQWAAGPAYRKMDEAQRSSMTQKVKEMLLSTLTKRLGGYANQDVRFFRSRRVGQNEVKVRVGILRAGGYPANIDFRFYRGKSGWKVFDVSANGNSAISFYRQYFARQARQQRPNWAYRR